VYGFRMNETFVRVGSRVSAAFRTTVPVNAYYFKNARAVIEDSSNVYDIPLENINGLQSLWELHWIIPESLSGDDFRVSFELDLYDITYKSEDSFIVSDTELLSENIDIVVDQYGPHDISFWLNGFVTKYVIPYTVFVYIRANGSEEELRAEFYEITTDSERTFVHLTRLFHDTVYDVTFRFTDPTDRVTDKTIQFKTEDVEIQAPLFYSIEVRRESDAIVASAVLYQSLGTLRWYVFLSHQEVQAVDIVPSLTSNDESVVDVRMNTLYDGSAIDYRYDLFVYFVSFYDNDLIDNTYVTVEYNVQTIRLIVGNF
jgi:hypothetical protein